MTGKSNYEILLEERVIELEAENVRLLKAAEKRGPSKDVGDDVEKLITDLANRIASPDLPVDWEIEQYRRFVAAVQQAERERCVADCEQELWQPDNFYESWDQRNHDHGVKDCIRAIKKRAAQAISQETGGEGG